MFPLQAERRSPSCRPLTGEFRSFPEDHFVFMATALGTVRKTALPDFSNPRKAGIIAVDLDEGDFLIGAALTDGHHDVMLFSDGGKAVRFDETMSAHGPSGARRARHDAGADQRLIAMLVAEDESQSVLTATENGYGKRTSIVEYTRRWPRHQGHDRHPAKRPATVASFAATLVRAEDEIMLITDCKGVLVRTRVSGSANLARHPRCDPDCAG